MALRVGSESENESDLKPRTGSTLSSNSTGSRPVSYNGGSSSSSSTKPASTTSSTRAGNGGASSSTSGTGSRLRQAEQRGGFFNPNGDKPGGARPVNTSSTPTPAKSVAPRGLRNSEEAGAGEPNKDEDDDRVGQGYTGDTETSNSTGKRRFKYKKQVIVGGTGAGAIIGIIFGISTVTQGPMEFVHFEQLMEKFHFSSQQDAQDSRLMKTIRYLRDPSKPQNTRMGIVGNAIANKLESKIHDATGLSPKYDKTTGKFLGYEVDREHSNFKELNTNQTKEFLATEFGVDPTSIEISASASDKQTISFNPESTKSRLNTVGQYRAQTKFSRGLLREAGLWKVATVPGSRVLGTRANWTFHPVQKLDATIQANALEAGKKGIDKLKEQFRKQQVEYYTDGVKPASITGEDKSAKDTNGKPVNPQNTQGAQEVADGTGEIAKEASEAADSLNNGDGKGTSTFAEKLTPGKIAGGAAGVAGLLCMIQGMNDYVNSAKFEKAILPMMEMASNIMSLGSQVQAGMDITTLQLGFFKEFLDSTDDSGKTTSTWNQARSIQAELGQPLTGPDLAKEAQVFTGTVFDALQIPGLDSVCSALSSPIGIVVQAIAAPASTLLGVASSPLVSQAMKSAAGWLAGAPVNPLASGADFGNFVNYGAKLSANDMFASVGGVALNAADAVAIKDTNNSLDQQEFDQKSLAYRLFNTEDSRTLAAHLIDDQGTKNATQTMATLASGFGSIFENVAKIPGSLISSHASAATDSSYDYHGVKTIGFTPAELTDSQFDNPFQNACYVVGCPDSNIPGIFSDPAKASHYEDLAQKCFGVGIANDGSGWNINSKTKALNMYDSSSYPSDECADTSNSEWTRVRFWLLDTNALESYDCYTGTSDTSDQSCADIGFDQTGGGGGDSSSRADGKLPTGSAQDLAEQLRPYISKGDIKCNGGEGADCSDIQNTAKGTSIRSGSCQVDALNAGLLGMLLELVRMGHTFVISALCSDHSTVDGPREHNGGRAVDFNYIDGVFMGPSADAPWDSQKIAAGKKLDQDIASFMPKSTEFGQVGAGNGQTQCHPTFDFQNDFPTYPDACHHQHVAVEIQ
jgi:hypothetical protein